ncbi:RNA polymerase Rpb4-domain-containing protein [Yarrowia lipolytica]|jgi:hypothetical protein|nr:hypothetical protein YALI1_D26142g [Yarrowia lipolytica]KAB8285800.1 RNA polymerase Rpb4-domain-containing protein [Yarrowia lipolytica]RDW26181.1 RNA polymerase Rpb4-domain-containing protein [Yarrowia lipolytica]RDW32932.1 RNA polymerase Rpb4-domain-containing protein [Yarrowia lipolytica]RDW45166.1 RNA polymerase Rpb4-domain-containing protein [Yarrowia lipolytica]
MHTLHNSEKKCCREYTSIINNMKVEKTREALLSNFEVLAHVRDQERARRMSQSASAASNQGTSHAENLETVIYELKDYLNKSPAASQSPEAITLFLQKINHLGLEKAERLQLINSVPTSIVSLYSLIEECDQRYNEDQCEEILDAIRTTLVSEEDAIAE